MATTKKSSTPKVEKKKIVCNGGCSKTPKATNNFYKSTREEYIDHDGYCTTCKACLRKSTIDEDLHTVTMDSIKDSLRKLNKPLIESIFIKVKNNPETTNATFLGNYISLINLESKYKNCEFSDTIDIQIEQEKVLNSKVEESKKLEVTDDMKLFWGRGLDSQDYLDMQSMFDEYTKNESNMTKKKLDDYKSLSIYELQKSKIQFDLSRIADTQKLQGLIDNLSSSLGIQAVQKQDDDKNERFTLGLLARYHEDIHKNPIRRWVEDLGGIDPIQKKIEVYYKGGILNAMGIQNPDIERYREEVEQYTVKLKQVEEDIARERSEVKANG